MRRYILILFTCFLLMAGLIPAAFGATCESGMPCHDSIVRQERDKGLWHGFDPSKLTNTQKREISNLEDQILQLKKQIVQKYAQYGALTQEQAKAIIERMEQKAKSRNGDFRSKHGHSRASFSSLPGRL